MTDTPPRPALPRAPETNPESLPFWEAAAAGTLLIGHCLACGTPHYYPRRHCPTCGSSDVEWRAASGSGEIYTLVDVARGPAGPFTMAYVTLDEGLRMITRIVGAGPAGAAIGQRVKLHFSASDGDYPYPAFTPA